MFKLAKLDKIFSILLFAAVPIGLYFAFFYAPVERIMGIVQKIFYFHKFQIDNYYQNKYTITILI